MRHVDEGQLHAYLDGQLEGVEPGAVALLEAHLAACPVCAARLEEARRLRDAASGILRAAEPARVELRSFEGLGSSTPAPAPRREAPNHRRTLQRRATVLAWAASLVVALGLGWLARDLQFSRDLVLASHEMDALEAPVALARSAPAEAPSQPEIPAAAKAEEPDAASGAADVPPSAPSGAAVEPARATERSAAPPVLAVTPAPAPADAPATEAVPAAAAEVTITQVTFHSRAHAVEALVTSDSVALDACAPATPGEWDAADVVILTAVAGAEHTSVARTAAGYAARPPRSVQPRAEAAGATEVAEPARLVELRQLSGPGSAAVEELLQEQSTRHAIVVPQAADPACHPPAAGALRLEPGAPVLLRGWLRPHHAWISGRPTFDVVRATQ